MITRGPFRDPLSKDAEVKRMKQLAQAGSCPVATTVSLIGGKWKLLIIRDLLNGPHRYMELKTSVQGISQKMLTQSLREMQQDGLVARSVKATIPPQVTYSLTQLGENLRPSITALGKWGTAYLNGPHNKFAPRPCAAQASANEQK